MNRRGFFASLAALAGGLVLPHEPKRIYSFLSRSSIWTPRPIINGKEYEWGSIVLMIDGEPQPVSFRSVDYSFPIPDRQWLNMEWRNHDR